RSLAWRSVWSRRSRVCHAERAACLAPAQLVGFQRALMPGGLLCAASGLETAMLDMHQPGLAFGCEFAGDRLRNEGPELLGMDGPAFEARWGRALTGRKAPARSCAASSSMSQRRKRLCRKTSS